MKKAVIIGGTSGIGKEVSKLLVDNNFLVGITGRRTNLLEELKKANSNSILITSFDVTDTNHSIEKIETFISELGGLDLLIFCAGTGDLNEKLEFETEKKTINLNVTGFTNIMDWTFNLFEKQGYGHLASISSAAGVRGSRQAPSYNASKAYQINYLEGLRQRATKTKKPIYVTDIRPGLVNTEMAKGDGLFWVMPVEKVAKQIIKAINKRRKVMYVTKRWGFIARILKILPRYIYDRF